MQSGRFSGNAVLSDRTAPTDCTGGQSGRGEGASGRRDMEATSRAGSRDIGTESSVGGRAGDGVFFVWSTGTHGESMLPGEYFVSVFATGLGGYYPGWPMSGGMAQWAHGAVSVVKRGLVWAGG